MRHRPGPTKRLAPSISSEMICPHIYAEDDGVHLEVDCSACAGAHDLSNNKCLAGVMNVVCCGAVPDTIILKRFIHKRYRRDTVGLAATAASELAALNRALAPSNQAPERACRSCAANKHEVIAEMRQRLLDDPAVYVISAAQLFTEIKASRAGLACARSSACVEGGLRASTLYGSGT